MNDIEVMDLNKQASMLIKKECYDLAEIKLNKAIDLDPMIVESYINYGDLYIALNDYENAKNYYRKAMLLKKDGYIHFLYGNACFLNDDYHEGLEHYNLAISEGYDNDTMLYFLGMAYENMNDYEMALRFYHKASLKNPSRPDYLVKKINVFIRLGLLDDAEQTVDDLLKVSPEMFEGYHYKTQLLLNSHNYDDAVIFSKKAYDKFPEDTDLLFDYAKSLALSGRVEETLQVIERAKKMKYFENSKRDFALLESEICIDYKLYDKAIECCKTCISLEDNYVDEDARYVLVTIYLTTHDYENALEMCDYILGLEKKNNYYYSCLYYKALCLKNLDRNEDAIQFYKEINMIYKMVTLKDEANIDIYFYRVLCMKELNEYDEALDLLEFISNLIGDSLEIHAIKYSIYKAKEDDNLAQSEIRRIKELNPDFDITLLGD